MTHSEKGMFDCEMINKKITLRNGEKILAIKQGKKAETIHQQDGHVLQVVLTNGKYVPALAPYNLFSITSALDKGFDLGNEGMSLTLSKKGVKIKFDKHIPTKSGWVCGAMMVPRNKTQVRLDPRLKEGTLYKINSLHELFGHHTSDTLKKTANCYVYKVKRYLEECERCAQAKARQKTLGNTSDDARAKRAGERLHMDISSIKSKSYGGAKFWSLIVDEFSN